MGPYLWSNKLSLLLGCNYGSRGAGNSVDFFCLGTVVVPLLDQPSVTSEANYFISSMSTESDGSLFSWHKSSVHKGTEAVNLNACLLEAKCSRVVTRSANPGMSEGPTFFHKIFFY